MSFYPLLFKYQYLYFSDVGPKLVFRYYTVGIIRGKNRSVEIPKKDFAGYTREKSYLGTIGYLILKQRIDRRVAKYPPVYITSLTKSEINKITDVLDRYIT